MPYVERTVEKLYWSIGEVGVELGVNTSLIRFWEKQFGTIKPKRTGKGDRLYTRKEIDQLKRIQHLVKEKGFTLNGAKEQLRKSEEPAPPPEARTDVNALRDRLLQVRARLVAMRHELDQPLDQ
ncbi:MAG: MerR family transcriptional regulator [Flavobacteriales bacterium]